MGVYIKGMTLDVAKWLLGATRDNEIIEVKTPHGRLIDADAEYKAIEEMTLTDEKDKQSQIFALLVLDNAKAVIEAEVE